MADRTNLGGRCSRSSSHRYIKAMDIRLPFQRNVQAFRDGAKCLRRDFEHDGARHLIYKFIVFLVVVVDLKLRTELEG